MNGTSQETQGRKKRLTGPFRALLIWAVLLGGLVLIFPGIIFVQCVTTIYRADEGFKRARRTIDPEELRRWAFQEIKKREDADNPEIPGPEIPDYIRNLYPGGPESAEAISGRDGSQPRVVIFWGGGFFHWVIEIGNTNYFKPYVSENPEYPHNYQWTNGIYYSHEGAWPLL